MKLNLVLLALLCFGNVAAQTTTERTTVYHNNGTVELHIAVRTIDSTAWKTLKYNEVSKADVDRYLDSGITVAAKELTFSMLHGPMLRKKMVYEKDKGLHYGITCMKGGRVMGWLIIVMTFCCMGISGYLLSKLKKNPLWFFATPFATGLFLSITIAIGDAGYQLNWDEQISYAVIGLVISGLLVFFKQIVPLTKSYWFRKRILLGRK